MKRILLYCFFQIIPPVVGSCWATDSDRSSLEEILADIEIPTSDVNFGTLQSEPGTSPPIGPLLQRYYAKKQRSLVIDSRDYAISIYRNFESEACEPIDYSQLSRAHDLIKESIILFNKGELYFNTIPQISIRFYKQSYDLLKHVYSFDTHSICK